MYNRIQQEDNEQEQIRGKNNKVYLPDDFDK